MFPLALKVILVSFCFSMIFGQNCWTSPKLSNEDYLSSTTCVMSNISVQISVIYNTSYWSSCPYKNIFPFMDVLHHNCLKEQDFPIWMPVNKNVTEYGYEDFKWREVSEYYGINFNDNYTYEKTISDKNCIIIHANLSKEAVSCDRSFNTVCIYTKNMFGTNLNVNYKEYHKDPVLTLSFFEDNVLKLEVQNIENLYNYHLGSRPIIKCFTDTGVNLVTYLSDIVLDQCSNNSCCYSIFLRNISGPGSFFCKTFNKKLEIVTSNKLFLRMEEQFQCEFVVHFVVTYSNNFNPFSVPDEVLNWFWNLVIGSVTFYSRIFKVINLNETLLQIKINIHFTIIKSTNETCIILYNTLRNELTTNIPNYNITLEYFGSSDFCMGITANSTNNISLRWPLININKATTPDKICIKNIYGEIISRKCGGNFIDGAKWEDITDSCELLETSNYTDILKKIKESAVFNDTVIEISQYYNKFTAVDIEFITDILCRYSTSNMLPQNPTTPENILTLISNIMSAPLKNLKLSQLYFNSTDKLINFLFNFAHNVEFSENILLTSNFFVINLEHVGIYLDDQTNIVYVDDDEIDGLRMNQSIGSGLILSRELFQLKPKITIFIFFNNGIFNSNYQMLLTSNISYGINIDQEISYPYYIFYNNYNESCTLYNYSKSFEYKGYWSLTGTDNLNKGCELYFDGIYTLADLESSVTENLYEILNSNDTIVTKLEKLDNLCKTVLSFRPIDIKYISDILELVSDSDEYNSQLTTSIVSSILSIPSDVLSESQVTYHATDRILYFIDKIYEKSNVSELIIEDNFSVITANLLESNASGIIIQPDSDNFNISIITNSDINNFENVESAVVLSDDLLNQLKNNSDPTLIPRLVITIYYKSVLFIDSNQNKTTLIFGVLLPDFNETFKGPVSILYNKSSITNSNENACAFWYFQVNAVSGSWKTEFVNKTNFNMSVCEFSHLTHFAMLLFDHVFDDKYHLLDIITNICCGLSLFGIVGILITAILFKKWRENTGNHILLNFVAAISIKIILLYVSNIVYNTDSLTITCIVFGAFLHYSILSEFCWMLIIAILQFKRFVEVLGGPPKYILVKAYVCGWIMPIIPVCILLSIDPNNYTEGKAGICYPTYLGLYLGVWLPISIIILINIVVFYYIMYNTCYRKTEHRDMSNQKSLFQWRLALLLFFMLGLTWSFGFISQINELRFFIYLFTITATLQGFIMFLFFILFNKSTRFLYVKTLKQLKQSNINYSVR